MASTIKNLNNQTRKLTKTVLNVESFYLKIRRKNLTLKKKNAENENSPKELWRTLKSIGMPSKRRGIVSFKSKDNVNTFCRLFSNLVRSLLQKPPRPKNAFGIKVTEEYYKQMRNERKDAVLRNIEVIRFDKILKNFYVTKDSRIDQISAKFLKDGVQ